MKGHRRARRCKKQGAPLQQHIPGKNSTCSLASTASWNGRFRLGALRTGAPITSGHTKDIFSGFSFTAGQELFNLSWKGVRCMFHNHINNTMLNNHLECGGRIGHSKAHDRKLQKIIRGRKCKKLHCTIC